jgi:hypothetical protein
MFLEPHKELAGKTPNIAGTVEKLRINPLEKVNAM